MDVGLKKNKIDILVQRTERPGYYDSIYALVTTTYYMAPKCWYLRKQT